MEFHSHFADTELIRYLLVHQPADHRKHHLSSRGSEGVDQRLNSIPFRVHLPPFGVEPYSSIHRIKKILIDERLDDKVHGPCLHRLYTRQYVRMSR